MNAQHALITGGSSGIGRALAHKLAAEGYDLSLIARRTELLQETARELERYFVRPGQRVFVRSADVSDAAQAAAAVKEAIAALGAPDLVVTSAGIAVPGYFAEQSLELSERSMAVNYFGSLYVVHAALPAMRARRQGRIVFMSSGAGLMGIFGYTTYSPGKFALRGLAEALRAELRADNIAVSIVFPPDTDTPMLEEENKTKPEETAVIAAVAKMWGAEGIANCVMRGLARNAFAITPGYMLTLINRMPGLMIPLLHWYCDKLVAGVARKRMRAGTASGGRASAMASGSRP
jgi:3-dehydrosphinganine reductase